MTLDKLIEILQKIKLNNPDLINKQIRGDIWTSKEIDPRLGYETLHVDNLRIFYCNKINDFNTK